MEDQGACGGDVFRSVLGRRNQAGEACAAEAGRASQARRRTGCPRRRVNSSSDSFRASVAFNSRPVTRAISSGISRGFFRAGS